MLVRSLQFDYQHRNLLIMFPLDPDSKKKVVTDEDIRKYMKWKAATSQLILQEINADPETDTTSLDICNLLTCQVILHLAWKT